MNRLNLLLVLLGLSAMLVAGQKHSNINFAWDYATLDILDDNTIGDYHGPYGQYTLRNEIQSHIGQADITLTKSTLKLNDIDWHGTKYFAGKNGYPAFIIKDLDATIEFDAEVRFGDTHEKSEKNILNVTLDVEINYGYSRVSPAVVSTNIQSAKPNIQAEALSLKGSIAKIKSQLEKAMGVPVELAALQIFQEQMQRANETLIKETSEPFSYTFSSGIEVRLSQIELPKLITPYHDRNNNPLQTFEFAFNLFRDGERIVVFNDTHAIPAGLKNFAPLQLLWSDELIQLAYWWDYQSDYNYVWSHYQGYDKYPIKFYTEQVTDIFPDIVKQYGEKKGLYIKAAPWGKDPVGKIENGKEINELPFRIEYWVDTESTRYPYSLDGCKACKLIANMTAVFSWKSHFFTVDTEHWGYEITEGDVKQWNVLSGNVNQKALDKVYNDFWKMVNDEANERFKWDGIGIPAYTKREGGNDTQGVTGNYYMAAGVDFAPLDKFKSKVKSTLNPLKLLEFGLGFGVTETLKKEIIPKIIELQKSKLSKLFNFTPRRATTSTPFKIPKAKKVTTMTA